jgi:hypothetical protein
MDSNKTTTSLLLSQNFQTCVELVARKLKHTKIVPFASPATDSNGDGSARSVEIFFASRPTYVDCNYSYNIFKILRHKYLGFDLLI